MAMTLRPSAVNALSRLLTSNSGIEARSPRSRSLRQIAEIDERAHVRILCLKARLDLEFLHSLQRIRVDPQRRVAVVVLHGHVDVGIHPDHSGVDQELAGF